MDATDLEHRALTRTGCIPPELVARLLERGRDDVVEERAGHGEWFCALARAASLGERGRQADALEVLAPYLATGWWAAAVAVADLLESWGRAGEAIDVARARMEAGHPMALGYYARLLARHGRADEAFTLLRPHLREPGHPEALVDIASAAGCEEEAVALLTAEAEHRCSDSPWCCGGLDRGTVVESIAMLRERQGRVDEAIALLSADDGSSVDHRERLAGLLGRHGRLAELRAAAVGDGSGPAVRRLSQLLEESGDPEGAVAVYGQADGGVSLGPGSAAELAELLARHGRGDEAIDVMRGQADEHTGDDWVLHSLAGLCLRLGRPEEGLAHLDALATARGGEEEWDLYWIRLPLLAAVHGVDEAVARARAHPEGATSYAAPHIAELLADAGRTEEAVSVLEPHREANRHDLAGCLIDLGRVDEALAVLRPTAPLPRARRGGPFHDDPPF
ncbi:tetratricopeptide repeat protein [Streptomyces californicus]|uniref:tetratricopeptide repeat protein n=1 Tax=Streptomyces californicus TaxID=67351 RepID=UPI0036595DDA